MIFQARSAGMLAVMQATRPDVSPAERAFMSEMKDMESYADRQQVCTTRQHTLRYLVVLYAIVILLPLSLGYFVHTHY